MKITRSDYEYWKVKKLQESPALFDQVLKRLPPRSGQDLIDGVINHRAGISFKSEPHNTMAVMALKMKRMSATEAVSNNWIDERDTKRASILRKWRKKLGVKL